LAKPRGAGLRRSWQASSTPARKGVGDLLEALADGLLNGG
jgi:hypothetical protein